MSRKPKSRAGASPSSMSGAELELLHRCLATVGSADFYPALVALPNLILECKRFLVMRYARFATPEFLLNGSLEPAAVDFYLRGLYRLDPLLRLVETGKTRPVATFRQIRLEDERDEFYDEIFRAALIYDELAVMIPAAGGACVALCYDRDGSEFTDAEVARVAAWQPVLADLHNLHVKTSLLTGLTSLFGGGSVGAAAVSERTRIFYRSDVWSELTRGIDEQSLIARAFRFPTQQPATFGNLIVHWSHLNAPRDDMDDDRVVFLEASRPAMPMGDIHERLVTFSEAHGLSPRQREILIEMTKGAHNAAIARRLGLTVGTVKNYKRQLYDKLDVTNEREIFPRIIAYLFGA